MGPLVAILMAAVASAIQVNFPSSSEGFQATPWPTEFTIAFTSKNGTSAGFLAYDWRNKQQLIFHSPNSTACSQYTQSSCVLLFNTKGTYMIIPSLKKCWLQIPGVGSLPPEWTTSGEFVGDKSVEGVGTCRAFAFPPTLHVYMETAAGTPCVFVFPDPDMTYYFIPQTFVVGAPDPDYFRLPEDCSEQVQAEDQ